MTVGLIFTKYISLPNYRVLELKNKGFLLRVLHFGHFFENRKNSGLTPGQNDDPVTRT